VLPSTTSNYIIHILTQNRYLMYVVVPGEKEERKRKKEKGKRNKERGWEPKSSENGKVENRKKNGFLCPAHSDSKVNSD